MKIKQAESLLSQLLTTFHGACSLSPKAAWLITKTCKNYSSTPTLTTSGPSPHLLSEDLLSISIMQQRASLPKLKSYASRQNGPSRETTLLERKEQLVQRSSVWQRKTSPLSSKCLRTTSKQPEKVETQCSSYHNSKKNQKTAKWSSSKTIRECPTSIKQCWCNLSSLWIILTIPWHKSSCSTRCRLRCMISTSSKCTTHNPCQS